MKDLKKSPLLHVVMIILWLGLVSALWYFYINGILNLKFLNTENPSTGLYVTAIIFLVLNVIFITYFWLNGVKDFLYVIWFNIFKKKLFKEYEEIINEDVSAINDKVLLVYCTCNDFEEKALSYSITQDYKNYDIVILDDSSDKEYIERVDKFALKNNIKVVRRKNRIGFKAGNINNYLLSNECKEKGYKYFVILDSDEIVPNNFIVECLKYFKHFDNVGVVQCTHIASNNRNFFMKLFHIGVNSHWNCYQTMKNKYGFSSLLGHGAMVEYESYVKVNGFPEMVAEDLCLSIEMKNINKTVAFAPNIICQEEYPVDYIAFKKRHSKWTQGNLEFIKNYTPKIIKSKMHWWEKLDIVLFTYNLPLTALFGFYIFINLIILPLLQVDLSQIYPLWMLIPTIIFFFSPTLNDFITWIGKINIFRFILYFISVIILYGSMLLTSLISALLGTFGVKAKFIVTPKDSKKTSFLDALKYQWKEIVFSLVLIVISIFIEHSILPVILISGTSLCSIILVFFSNIRYDATKTYNVDRKTSSVSIKRNPLLHGKVDLPYLGSYSK